MPSTLCWILKTFSWFLILCRCKILYNKDRLLQEIRFAGTDNGKKCTYRKTSIGMDATIHKLPLSIFTTGMETSRHIVESTFILHCRSIYFIVLIYFIYNSAAWDRYKCTALLHYKNADRWEISWKVIKIARW